MRNYARRHDWRFCNRGMLIRVAALPLRPPLSRASHADETIPAMDNGDFTEPSPIAEMRLAEECLPS